MRRLSTAAAATLATVDTAAPAATLAAVETAAATAVVTVPITNFTIQFLIKVFINRIFGHFSKSVLLMPAVAPRLTREAIPKRWSFISRIPIISRPYSVRIHLDRVT